MVKRTLRGLALVVVVLGLMSGSAAVAYRMASDHDDPAAVQTTERESATTGYSDCGIEAPTSKPATMTMTCADGGLVVNQIDWRSWGSTMSLGTGTVSANNCQPDCAQGTNIDYPVTLLLDQVETNGAGPQFSRAVLVYGDRTPNLDGREVDVFDLTLYSQNTP